MEESDANLTARVAHGDRDAFAELYRRHQAAVYRFARHMTGRAATAEDVTQEVFLTLMRTAAQYDASRAELTTYLYTITRTIVFRTMALKPSIALHTIEDELLSTADDPLQETIQEQAVRQLRAAVARLPRKYREAIVLCDLEEFSYAEAAAIVGCREGTIRSRLHRARRILTVRLRRWCQEHQDTRSTRCPA